MSCLELSKVSYEFNQVTLDISSFTADPCGAWFISGTHWHHSNDSLLPDNEPEIILK